MTKQTPPIEVTERFLPQERPVFKLLRRVGPCRLWRSKTTEHELFGCARQPHVRYHVTTGDDADYVLMPRFTTAMLNFELTVREVSHD
ncbi:hypothetical protein D9M72_585440 [compost metagenome]